MLQTTTDANLMTAVHEITEMLEREGNVRAIFGAAIKLETRTIVPVAGVAIGGGGGGVRALGAALEGIRRRLFKKDVRVEPSHTGRRAKEADRRGEGGPLNLRRAGRVEPLGRPRER